MRRFNFVLVILSAIIININAVSVQALLLQDIEEPTTKTAVQKENDCSTGTIKLNFFRDSCYVIIAQYRGNECISADVRKYQNETEKFNILNDADTVKIMTWKDLRNVHPVTKAEIINMKLIRELDKKVEKIANNLKTNKNPNVTIYKTEENEPRAIIWTKGIEPPNLSEFEKEIEITDSSYSFLYARQDKGSGWYDVNKSLPDKDGGDRNMCYAAVSANQLHWWLDQNKEYIDEYLNQTADEEDKDKLSLLNELRISYEGQSKSGIYNLFRQYFESPNYAYNANLLNDFFINGYQVNTLGKVNSPDFFERDYRGGFFYNVFEKNILTNRLWAGDYSAFKRDIIYYMKDGQSIGIIHNTPSNGVTHIITLWGVEINHNNEITALFVTDSDDYEQPKIGMKRMLLKKNSSGYPIISTKINDNNSGAQILEFVTLSSGEEYWEKILASVNN